ncbi:UNVERIFIED_ORG: HEAT repeat protein [Rhizobium aethiopicum]
MGLLLQLLQEGWHFKHEDVVSALADLKAPEAVEALYKVTYWVPSYLEFDDARALAVKAIWALGAIADPPGAGLLDGVKHESKYHHPAKRIKAVVDAGGKVHVADGFC